ncbi:MAG TPA: hypothetical protein VFR49_15770, partial [Solirubrobacteraceae bacterium]|nr:hypothetical protein [Solirubrobacteraceae bacterium]
ALELARALGAHTAMVSGSGPTVLGLFETPGGARRAALAAAGCDPPALASIPFIPGVRHNPERGP